VREFAARLHEQLGASRVLLFGSRARGDARDDSDYDFIVISPEFGNVDVFRRSIGLWDIWRAAGGDSPTDFICLTPEEFERARAQITLISAVLPESIDLLPIPATA